MSQRPPTPAEGWMIVYVAHSEPEALIVAGRLENQGIEAFVHREVTGNAYGVYTDPLGEVSVLVHPDDYEQAAAILDEDVEGEDDEDASVVQDDDLAPSTAWMVVYVAYSEPEAYVVAGRLESEGIPSFVHQEPAGRAYGFTVGPMGEVKVLVHPDDYDRATEILDTDVEADDSDDLDIIPDDDDADE